MRTPLSPFIRAIKGGRNTGYQTIHVYYEYCAKFKEARNSNFAILWDNKLKQEAIKQHLLENTEKEKNVAQEENSKCAIVGTGFGMDLCDGVFDGDMGEGNVTGTENWVSQTAV